MRRAERGLVLLALLTGCVYPRLESPPPPSQAFDRPASDSLAKIVYTFVSLEIADVRNEHNPVACGNSQECDETDQ